MFKGHYDLKVAKFFDTSCKYIIYSNSKNSKIHELFMKMKLAVSRNFGEFVEIS